MTTIDLTKYESITAEAPAGRVSDKYRFIPTTDAIQAFEDKNWKVSAVSETRAKTDHRRGYQRHMVRFRHRGQNVTGKTQLEVGGVVPEIVLINAHDGTASFRIMAGLFRLICSNGLVVADSVFSTMKIKHLEYSAKDIHEAIEHVGDTIPRIMGRILEFQQIPLTEQDQRAYADEALALRHGRDAVLEGRVLADPLLTPIRREESGNSLWETYNRVQEKILKGDKYQSNNRNPGNPIKTRGVQSIKEEINVNQGLWYLAEEMASIKTAA